MGKFKVLLIGTVLKIVVQLRPDMLSNVNYPTIMEKH